MTRESDFIAQLEDYLDDHEGSTPAADAVREAIRAGIPSIHQRPAWWPGLETFRISNAVAVGAAAAAVVIAAVFGINSFAPGGPSLGYPGADPTSAAAPSPMAWPAARNTDLAAGTYLADGPAPVRTTISVPDGWFVCGVRSDVIDACSAALDREVSVSIVDNLVSDPCDPSRVLLDPPVGESVDDLVGAISNLSGFEATEPIDITLDRFAGKEFELTAPTDPDCVLDEEGLGTWAPSSSAGGTNGVGPGEVNLLRIIDVDGVRVMIAGAYQPHASAEEIAEVRAIFQSVRLSRQP